MRYFIFTYKSTKKYSVSDTRKKFITLSKSTGNIGIDAKNALGIFLASTGTFKEVQIIEIQEVDEQGAAIGLPITPSDDAIVPVGR